jgi:hypothetical protein
VPKTGISRLFLSIQNSIEQDSDLIPDDDRTFGVEAVVKRQPDATVTEATRPQHQPQRQPRLPHLDKPLARSSALYRPCRNVRNRPCMGPCLRIR